MTFLKNAAKTFQSSANFIQIQFKVQIFLPFQSKQVKQPSIDLNFSITFDDGVKTRNKL